MKVKMHFMSNILCEIFLMYFNRIKDSQNNVIIEYDKMFEKMLL